MWPFSSVSRGDMTKDTSSRRASNGGVAENVCALSSSESVVLCLVSATAKRDLTSGRCASPLFTSTHLTGIGRFPVVSDKCRQSHTRKRPARRPRTSSQCSLPSRPEQGQAARGQAARQMIRIVCGPPEKMLRCRCPPELKPQRLLAVWEGAAFWGAVPCHQKSISGKQEKWMMGGTSSGQYSSTCRSRSLHLLSLRL